MKLVLLLLVLLISLPFSSAPLEIVDRLEEKYNLGDNIKFFVKITSNESVNALARMTLNCGEKELPYYITPVSLEGGVEAVIDVPPLKAFTEGSCIINVNVESLEGKGVGGISSEVFVISNLLELSVAADKSEASPGEVIKIKGSASKKGNAIDNGVIAVELGSTKWQSQLEDKDFSCELKLDKKIRSGNHTIIAKVNDSYKNYNEKRLEINVKAIPTLLELGLNKKEFKQDEKLEAAVKLLDQADEPVKGNVGVKLLRKKGLFTDELLVFDKAIESNSGFSFLFNSSIPPDDYSLIGSFGMLEKEEKIAVLPSPKISADIDGNIIILRNLGNVRYNNETVIVAEKENKTYLINKNVKLDVGEEVVIDLSKEIPSGTYTVTLPPEAVSGGATAETAKEKAGFENKPRNNYAENKENEGINEEKAYGEITKTRDNEGEDAQDKKTADVKVIKNVEINEDNRPGYKKGLEWITGAVVAGRGLLLSRPGAASFIMVLIILSIVAYYDRKGIKKLVEKIKKRK